MLTIVQLMDSCYKVVIEYSTDGFTMRREYTFAPAESNAEPDPSGEHITLKLAE